MARKNRFLVVKLFDLCYSEYAWDSLSKRFFVQFYFTKTIATMQKATAKTVAFLIESRHFCPSLFAYSATFSVDSGVVTVGFELESSCLSLDDSLFVSARVAFVLIS